jgi:uncharacterized membrane protein YeaQ/YmgE (transglycosylase-associated protein family)
MEESPLTDSGMSAEMVIMAMVVAVICGGIGMVVANTKGNAAPGFFLGVLMGPVGILIAMLLPENSSSKRAKCRSCGHPHEGFTKRCPGCGAMLQKKKFVPSMAVDPIDEWERREKSGKKLPPL